ncbi:MAG: phosphoglucosamine mutase [Bacteroidetes bacterium]|nr:phosphoglucosamine mutase [Bacteroidota bacterium]
MPLMVSISGIRGIVSDGLTPQVIVDFVSAYATWARQASQTDQPTIILGRDSRVTGKMVSELVSSTLNWSGCHVIDLGVVPTPTVQVAVEHFSAQGGIIVSASHNPAEWNALKLLNGTGEFMSPEEGETLLAIKNTGNFHFSAWNQTGSFKKIRDFHQHHIETLLSFPFIDYSAIRKAGFKVVVDGVEGAGSVALPMLLEKLGCTVIRMNCGASGLFPHTPEPLPQNLTGLMERVVSEKADLGLALDPDADRLAAIMENGEPFGEEYTITAATDYFLKHKKGDVVVNLSTTRAVADVARRHGTKCHYSKVGEINVVKMMQETGAVIGGEGSGGVILPDSHYGRDSLVAALLIIAWLADGKKPVSELRKGLPFYEMAKKKVDLGTQSPDPVIEQVRKSLQGTPMDTRDGLKIDFPDRWVHLRKSNTEPIIRIYTEAPTAAEAEKLASEFVEKIRSLVQS